MIVEKTLRHIFNPIPTSFERILPTNLLTTLGFSNWPQIATPDFVSSLQKSDWYTVAGGRMVLEVRDPSILERANVGKLLISDLDDTLVKTSLQHEVRLRRLPKSQQLRQRGIYISTNLAREVYKLSKITDPGTTEPRYTPQYDLALMSFLAQALEKDTGLSQNQALQILQNNQLEILKNPSFDPDVISTLINDPTQAYLYKRFVKNFLKQAQPEDIKAINTRGEIGGPHSQVYKAHTSDLMDRGIQLALYTLDFKSSAIQTMQQIFPQNSGIELYEDSPTEVENLLKEAFSNVTIFRVPNGKRKSTEVKAQPVGKKGSYMIYKAA